MNKILTVREFVNWLYINKNWLKLYELYKYSDGYQKRQSVPLFLTNLIRRYSDILSNIDYKSYIRNYNDLHTIHIFINLEEICNQYICKSNDLFIEELFQTNTKIKEYKLCLNTKQD